MTPLFRSPYPLLRVAELLIAGLLLGHAFPVVEAWLVVAAVVLVAALAAGRRVVLQSVLLQLLWLVLGGCLMARAVTEIGVQLPDRDVDYEAVITSEPTVHGKVVMADMLIINEHGDPMKVKASIQRDTPEGRWRQLQVGSGIRARSLLVPPTNFRSGPFDYARYLREHGYRACTIIYMHRWQAAAVSLRSLSSMERVVLLAKQWRHQLLQHLSNMGVEGQEYAVIAALTLGEKSFLSKDLQEDYSISGASHVLALSGLHMSILFTLLSLLLRPWRRQWLAQLFILLLVWSYVVLVGFSPSVVRSATMLTMFSLVTMTERNGVTLNTLSLAAIVLLWVRPLTLYDIGFQMSFMAVLGIVLLQRPINRIVPFKFLLRHRRISWAWSMVTVSLAAQLFVSPLVLHYFGRFSCYFLLSNFVAIPCATIILYATIMLVPLALIPVVGTLWAQALSFVVAVMNGSLGWVASLPGASVEGLYWTWPQVVAGYALLMVITYSLMKLLPGRS